MTTTVNIGGKEVRVRVSARTPFDYRELFFSDLIDDMHRVCTGAAGADTIEVVEKFLWICARNAGEDVHADLPAEDAIAAWLDEFDDMYAMYKALPVVIEMWQKETQTTSEAKKKDGLP